MTAKKWIVPKPITDEADQALAAFPRVIRQVLFSRGILTEEKAKSFLNADGKIEDPFQIKNMNTAVDRIFKAIQEHEKVAIYGDYDVDGVTATALMVEAVRQAGGQAEGYIPNRFDEGYGLNNDALDSLREQGFNLVVTVDCGIRSPGEAKHAKEIGLDLIISDHHHPKGDIPNAVAVLCPKQEGDEYPNKDLAGVGLAFKIVQALWMAHPELGLDPENWLDLVALGTVADVVNLSDENRALVRKGITRIREGKRLGLLALSFKANWKIPQTNSFDIGFVIAPRLNAAGRLKSAMAALNLLLTSDIKTADELAEELNKQNGDRQELTKEIQTLAESMTAGEGEPYFLFAASEEFNQGVVGLAASRLVEKYYRPAIVAKRGEEVTKGSGRSIPEFHITQALDECSDLLVRHGGHAMAAGFTVKNENVEELINKLKEIARRELGERIEREELTATLRPDAEVDFNELKFQLLNDLENFQPVGMGNPEPLFLAKGVKVLEFKTLSNNAHLKMRVSQDNKYNLDAVAWRMGNRISDLPKTADFIFSFEKNFYNGLVTLQLNIRDFRPSENPY